MLIEIVKSSSGKLFIRDLRGRVYRPVTAKTILNTGDAAQILGCSVQYIHKLMKAGRLPYVKKRGFYYIGLYDLVKFKKQYFKERCKTMGYISREQLREALEQIYEIAEDDPNLEEISEICEEALGLDDDDDSGEGSDD